MSDKQPPVDMIEYATRLRASLQPMLDELPGDPAQRLATVMVAACLMLPADGETLKEAGSRASKVLTDYVKSGRKLGPPPSVH